MTFEAPTAPALPEADMDQASPSGRKYSYSRKRKNAFEVWQEHVRKSADAVSGVFLQVPDRAW
jgi:hypothetical protein